MYRDCIYTVNSSNGNKIKPEYNEDITELSFGLTIFKPVFDILQELLISVRNRTCASDASSSYILLSLYYLSQKRLLGLLHNLNLSFFLPTSTAFHSILLYYSFFFVVHFTMPQYLLSNERAQYFTYSLS